MKVYDSKDKYDGKENFIEPCIVIFEDLCERTRIGLVGYRHALPTMLTGTTRHFYFTTLAKRGYSYQEIVDLIKAKFKTDERH